MSMNYKLLGESGLRVSELSLGAMTFGEEWGWGAPKDESLKMIDTFAAAGGNFIDTADGYTAGTSERMVGEFVRPDRERFVVATKYSFSGKPGDPNAGGNHRKRMVEALNGSLKRLGEASKVELGFPMDFLHRKEVREFLHGGIFERIRPA